MRPLKERCERFAWEKRCEKLLDSKLSARVILELDDCENSTHGTLPDCMSRTRKPGDIGPDAVEEARAFLGEIGLAPILAKGVVQMLKACPRPRSGVGALIPPR